MENNQSVRCILGTDIPFADAVMGGSLLVFETGLCFTPAILPGSSVDEIGCTRDAESLISWDEFEEIDPTWVENCTETPEPLRDSLAGEYIGTLVDSIEDAGNATSSLEVAPTQDACRFARQFLQGLFSSYGIIPYKVTHSKEGGIYAAYRSPRDSGVLLRVEIDNELDVVATVSRNKEIVASGFFESDEAGIIRAFDERLAGSPSV